MGYESLSAMLAGICNGGAKSLVRVGGFHDRSGIQQALDMGADGVLVPYITQAGAYVKDIEGVSKQKGQAWQRRPSNLL